MTTIAARMKRSGRRSSVLQRKRTASSDGAAAATRESSLQLRALQGLRTIFGTARTHDVEVRKGAGVSGSQLWALSEIAGAPQKSGITVNALSAQMALHQTTTSNLVNSLVERRLIRRERGAADQRTVHLRPTAQGKQLLLRTPGPHDGLLVDALRRLESSQLLQLLESLEWIVAHMRRTAETAAGESLMGE